MRHALGLSSEDRNPLWPLEPMNLLRFDTDFPPTAGYFSAIAPLFDKYARRDANCAVTFINVLFVLRHNDLKEVLESLEKLQTELEQHPPMWREHLGEVRHPGQPPKPLNPMLFRSRALRIVFLLRNLATTALRSNKVLVYGNGVCYRHLLGIPLPPGTEEYS